MSTAAAALRAAIHDALSGDGTLTALLGGARVYDEPPKSAAFPYVTLGEARITDFSTGTEPGEEHALTLHAWSRQGGHREAHLIAGALLQALDDAPLTLDRPPPRQPALRGRRHPPRDGRPHLSRGGALPRRDRTRITRTASMSAQKGKDLLVKIADGVGFTTVAGLRTRRLSFNAETVDITHAESAGRWRELLDGAGIKRAGVSGRGLFKDAGVRRADARRRSSTAR